MNRAEFTSLVRTIARDLPIEYLDGIADLSVSPKTAPHPVRAGVFTLGECRPLWTGDPSPEGVQSRVVLYYGSFLALAHRDPAFDWAGEAWETVTHEIRHHLEWRARSGALERYDQAQEENFARQAGDAFDPDFYRMGELVAPGLYAVDEDLFLEQRIPAGVPAATVPWHGGAVSVAIPPHCTFPAFLTLRGLRPDPIGDVVLVLQERLPWWRWLARPHLYQEDIAVEGSARDTLRRDIFRAAAQRLP